MCENNVQKISILKMRTFISELKRLRGNDMKLVEDEILQMDKEAILQSEKRSLWSVITDRTLLLPLSLVCLIQVGHQLSGINAVSFH